MFICAPCLNTPEKSKLGQNVREQAVTQGVGTEWDEMAEGPAGCMEGAGLCSKGTGVSLMVSEMKSWI